MSDVSERLTKAAEALETAFQAYAMAQSALIRAQREHQEASQAWSQRFAVEKQRGPDE